MLPPIKAILVRARSVLITPGAARWVDLSFRTACAVRNVFLVPTSSFSFSSSFEAQAPLPVSSSASPLTFDTGSFCRSRS
jgi:hypothetical protein